MTNVKIDLAVNCLNCKNIDIQDNIQRLYSNNDPEMAYGNITCSHHLVCPIIAGKKKISEIIYDSIYKK